MLCFQEALQDLQTFADSWRHFIGYVQIMLPYQLLRQVTTVAVFSTRSSLLMHFAAAIHGRSQAFLLGGEQKKAGSRARGGKASWFTGQKKLS